MNEQAVADAIHNAQIDDIKNAMFTTRKVEQKIHEGIRKVNAGRQCVVIRPSTCGIINECHWSCMFHTSCEKNCSYGM